MTVVITLQAAQDGPAIAASVAQRLTGPAVVVPFDSIRREWIAKPQEAATDARVAAQQLKLLAAGYLKAGYHVVVHGHDLGSGETREDLLRLVRMVPGAYALAVGVGVEVPVELALGLQESPESVAQAVWETLPPDA